MKLDLSSQVDALTRIWQFEGRAKVSIGDSIELLGDGVLVDGVPLDVASLSDLEAPLPAADFGSASGAWIELHYDLGAHGNDLAQFREGLKFLAVLRRGGLAEIEVTDGSTIASFIASLEEPNFGYVYDIGLAFKERDVSILRFRPHPPSASRIVVW